MTLTPYDRRQVELARRAITRAAFQVDLSLTDGRYAEHETGIRLAFAGRDLAEAAEILLRTDRRITRRRNKAVSA